LVQRRFDAIHLVLAQSSFENDNNKPTTEKELTSMKTVKSVNVGSFALYGAVLAAFWTFVFGVYYWLLGWIFGAQSWFIDMNLGNWTVYTMTTFGLIFLKAFIVAAGGALAGAVIAWIYNIVAGMMGGLKINVE
jgi:hypothetical protein